MKGWRFIALATCLAALPVVAFAVTVQGNFFIHVSGGGGETLPTGVTLQAIDGESLTGSNANAATTNTHSYYGGNGFTNAANASFNGMSWDDPRFFPIGDDFPFYSVNSTTTFKSLGLNLAHRMTGDATYSMLNTAGIWALPQPGDGTGTPGAETVGFHIEEPADWSTIESLVQSEGSLASGRFQQASFTWNQLHYGTVSGAPGDSTMRYVMGSPIAVTGVGNVTLNIPGSDIYWFAGSTVTDDCGPTYEGAQIYGTGATTGACGTKMTADQMARGDHYGDMTDIMRTWLVSPAVPAPIIAPYIETEDGLLGDTGKREILPQEFNWAVMSSVVHGARGMLYFGTTSNFGSGSTFGFSESVLSGASVSMYDQAIATNTLVTNLAPLINSPFALNYALVTPAGYVYPASALNYGNGLTNGIDIMAKWYTGGTYSNATGTFSNGFYIFTTVRGSESQSNINATFTLAGSPNKTIPVVGESRNVSTNGSGVFTDTFANAYTIHIYGPVAYP